MRKNGSRIALDATAAIAIFNDRGDSRSWVRQFEEVFLPVPVVGELRFGALKSTRTSENLRRINDLVSRSQILEVRLETTQVYARLRLNLRRKGKPIPENDLWIAAICAEHRIPLATTDGHFEEIDELDLEPLSL
jgi:tRNA(fMet)-specific endonuclease VapC